MMHQGVDAVPSDLSEAMVSTQLLNQTVLAGVECRARNDRQTCFSMARKLVDAQFVLADQELTRRL
ncbi:hypothetical protein MITS9509_02324 [Synechococcus sp. MIT S9509]|nr:hypothetical protein MITS9509_02324 [Synechococcus sp. MIT S9509]